MKHLITFSLNDYIRSHKYFPPVSTFFILIIVFYSYKPNPVLDSYAVTAVFLYIISAWVCITILSLDPPVQREIMAIQLKSWNRYYLSKIMTACIISILLTLYAYFYPIVFNMFKEPVSLKVGFVSVLNHLILSLLGISLACLFSKIVMKSRVNSFGGLVLMIVISIAALGIYNVLPSSFEHIVWLIPPATITQKPLMNWTGESLSELSFIPFIWVIIYSLILVYFFIKLAKRIR